MLRSLRPRSKASAKPMAQQRHQPLPILCPFDALLGKASPEPKRGDRVGQAFVLLGELEVGHLHGSAPRLSTATRSPISTRLSDSIRARSRSTPHNVRSPSRVLSFRKYDSPA